MFLIPSFCIRADGLPIYPFLQPEASFLIELIPSIDSGISSEVLQAFNCTISTYVIVISGLKMFSYGSEWGKYWPLTLARAARIPYAMVSPISWPISQANTPKIAA
ncbi:MAG: hypothetical protein J4N73_11100, partial [Chloroflexi bacterium]|nr:hypothetical protein [Chloroflexota bacterium]